MKKIIDYTAYTILIMGAVAIVGFCVYGLIDMAVAGYWYVSAGLVLFIASFVYVKEKIYE